MPSARAPDAERQGCAPGWIDGTAEAESPVVALGVFLSLVLILIGVCVRRRVTTLAQARLRGRVCWLRRKVHGESAGLGFGLASGGDGCVCAGSSYGRWTGAAGTSAGRCAAGCR